MPDTDLTDADFDAEIARLETAIAEHRRSIERAQESRRQMFPHRRDGIPPVAQPVARVPVAMTDSEGTRTVLCKDGSVWVLDDSDEDKMAWIKLPCIPQPQDRDRVEAAMADAQDER